MMQVMTDEQVAEHDARMKAAWEAMPVAVRVAIWDLSAWCEGVETWDDAVDRCEAVRWWIEKGVDTTGKPIKPREAPRGAVT